MSELIQEQIDNIDPSLVYKARDDTNFEFKNHIGKNFKL